MRRLVPLMLAAGVVVGIMVALRPAAPSTASTTTRPPAALSAVESTTTLAPTTTLATVSTEPPLRTVAFRVAGSEMAALSTGARIAIYDPPVRLGALSAAQPQDALLLSPQIEELVFAYETADGGFTSVEWAQPVPPNANVIDVSQPWRARSSSTPSDPIVLGWQVGDAATGDPGDVDPRVTVVAPIWWRVGPDGHLTGSADAGYVDAAHTRGLDVWATVASLDAGILETLLTEPEVRDEVAERLVTEATAAGADGINIDFEGFREEDGDDFTAFVRQVTDLAHTRGLVVSYDLIPRTDNWEVSPPEFAFWSNAPDRRSLAQIVDYTILMAYDMFNGIRPAGPVAPVDWVEASLVYLFRYADPHTVILGVPMYGRVWNPEALSEPRAISTRALVELAAQGAAEDDPTHRLPIVTLEDGRFLWLEDAATMAERFALVRQYGLAGIAAWRLGLDSSELWDVLD